MKSSIIAAVVLILALAGVTANAKNNDLDLLSGHDWSHMVGGESDGNNVKIIPLGRVITHKDTTAAQGNSPINIRGPELGVSGDFQIEAQTTGTDKGASLQLYSSLPIIYDEWRQEGASVRVDLSADAVRLSLWDGSGSSPIDYRQFRISAQPERTVTIRVIRGWLEVVINDITLGSMPTQGIFETNTSVRFGMDAVLGTEGWILQSLTAKGLSGGSVRTIAPPSLTVPHNNPVALRNLAKAHPRKLPMGVAVSLYPLATDNRYKDIALNQFSMITPENELKPQAIHPQKNTYSFADADSLVEIAQKNGMQVHGHTLVMPKANPHWMERSRKEDRKQVMIDHINTVVGRYRKKISQWDVVNEPLSEEDGDYSGETKGLRKQMWYDALGEEYIDLAFKTAHAADPKAKLFLNDFGLAEDNTRWKGLIDLVKRLQSRGVPIHGIGFESHVYHKEDSIDSEILRRHIQELAAIGIESRISEIDVLGDEEDHQAKQYAEVLKVCLSEPTCTSYGTWGVTDAYGSTTLSDRYPAKLGDSLIWDKKYRAKPAYEALQLVLKGQ